MSTTIAQLFTGYSKAYGQFKPGEPGAPGEKVEGRVWIVKEPVTEELWKKHLTGIWPSLGVFPLLDDDGTVIWGCIDIDDNAIDHAALEKKINSLNLPLVIARSKSGGAHCFLFLTEPAPAALMRKTLKRWAADMGIDPKVEIFPKQDKRPTGKFGNWLNMPYFAADGTERHGVKDGYPLTLDEFVDYASSKRVRLAEGPPTKLIELCERVAGAKEGERNNILNEVAFEIGRYIANGDLDEGLAVTKLREATERTGLGAEEIERTIHGAVEKGKEKPRALIEPSSSYNSHIDDFNNRFAVAMFGSKLCVFRYVPHQLAAGEPPVEVPEFMTPGSLHGFTATERIMLKDEMVAVSRLWWVDKRRRTYENVVFAPDEGEEIPGTRYPVLNLWRGFAVEPKAGDWSKMKDHVLKVLARGNKDHFDYIIKWTAWGFQHPELQAEVALGFKGKKGSGKGVFGRALLRTYGAHGMQVSNRRHVVGNFNAHFLQLAMLWLDEAMWPGNKEDEGVLKSLITERTLPIEAKGVNTISAPNHLKLVMTGNDDWLVPASGADERRYAVFGVPGTRVGDRDYFNALFAEMDNGGLAAMLHDMLAMKLGDWHPRQDVPQTEELRLQKMNSRRGVDALIEMVANDGHLPNDTDMTGIPKDVAPTVGDKDGKGFWWWARNTFPELKYQKPRTIMADMRRNFGCKDWHSGNKHGVRFPPPGRLRELFEKKHGSIDWDGPAPVQWGEDVSS